MAGRDAWCRWWLGVAASRKWPLLVLPLVACATPLIALLINRDPPRDWGDLFEGLAILGLAGLLVHFAAVITLCALIRWWTMRASDPLWEPPSLTRALQQAGRFSRSRRIRSPLRMGLEKLVVLNDRTAFPIIIGAGLTAVVAVLLEADRLRSWALLVGLLPVATSLLIRVMQTTICVAGGPSEDDGEDRSDHDSDWGKGPPWSPSLVPAPRKPPSLAAHAAPPVE